MDIFWFQKSTLYVTEQKCLLCLLGFSHICNIWQKYGDSEARSLWSRLQLKIPEFFKGMDIKPSLLHGDLWSGNVAEMDDGPGLLK